MNYLDDIYKLAHIKRYSNVLTIRQESVADHSFMVAAILFDLRDKYNFSLGVAIQIAIAHDMPEMELNDCPHIIKRKYPAIAEAFEECEKNVAKELPEAARAAIDEYNKKLVPSVESRMVHYADALQCLQYATSEIALGNTGYMIEVLHNSQERVDKFKQELKSYERS